MGKLRKRGFHGGVWGRGQGQEKGSRKNSVEFLVLQGRAQRQPGRQALRLEPSRTVSQSPGGKGFQGVSDLSER